MELLELLAQAPTTSKPSQLTTTHSRAERKFERPPSVDPHNPNNNYILDGRIRITPVAHFHWDDGHGVWVGWGERWNRLSKTWSEPQWFVCREFECEGNNLTEI